MKILSALLISGICLSVMTVEASASRGTDDTSGDGQWLAGEKFLAPEDVPSQSTRWWAYFNETTNLSAVPRWPM